MKVLVTGGAGYIGSTTAALLVEKGHEVVVLDDLSRGHRSAVPAGCRLVVGNIGDRQTVSELLGEGGFEGLIHFAAFAYVGESTADPGLYLRNNVAGSIVLFDEAYKAGVRRTVFSSSCTVYGVPQKLPLVEDHSQAALSPYGASKMMCEEALRWFAGCHDDFGAVALRYFNAAGATELRGEDHAPETHLIPLAIQAAAGRRGELKVFGTDYPTRDGTCVRDYVHILDLADAHARAIEAAGEPGFRAYNVGSGVGSTVREVLDMVGEVVGKPVPHSTGPRREGDAAELYAAGEKIRSELGWEARHSDLRRIVSDAWAWHATHPEGYDD